MTPVFPYLVRKSEDGWRGELLLRLKHQKSVFIVHLSLEQARTLAVEMRGLATDHCPQHHLALQVAEAFGARISHIVIRPLDPTGEVMGVLRLETSGGLSDVNVDAAAALAMAIHVGLPIFMDGNFPSGYEKPQDTGLSEAPTGLQVPQAFRDIIEELDLPEFGEDST